MPEPNRSVFVVHGRNTKARDAMFDFLRALDLHPIEWTEAVQATGKATPYIGEILDAAFAWAGAVVVLFTPDDEARQRHEPSSSGDAVKEAELSGQARANVIFEAGMARQSHKESTVFVELGKLRPFSDISGLHVVRLDDSPERRRDLVNRLGNAGCPVKLDSDDWQTAGDFKAAIAASELNPTGGTQSPATARDRPREAAGTEPTASLSRGAKELLMAAAQAHGTIILFHSYGGTRIKVLGHVFDSSNPRATAQRESELDHLVQMGLVVRKSETETTTLFSVTHRGYRVADEK